METVSYKTALDLFTDVIGSVVGSVTNVDAGTFNRLFNRVIRRGWEHYFWPPLMLHEQRWYRDDWTAAVYATDAEVYHAATGKYWMANAPTVGGDVPGASVKWSELAVVDAYIGYEQSGKTALGTVLGIRNANFRTSRPTRRLDFVLDERGATLTESSVPTSAWIQFRRRCPSWKGATFDAAGTYASGISRYYSSATEGFDGDFWTALAATNAAESPETHPAKWSRIQIPAFLCDFAVNGAKLGYLEGDGQLEKALANAQSDLWTHLYDEQDKLTGQSGQYRKARAANV